MVEQKLFAIIVPEQHSTMSKKILIGYPINQERLQALQSPYEVHALTAHDDRYEQVLSRIEAYDGLFAISHPVDKQLMDKAKRLKVVANYGVGYDNIDVAYAKQKGIAVTNTPQSTTAPTANFAMGLMLSLLRKIVTTDRWLRQGDVIPFWGHKSIIGEAIGGKTLGILGMGRIGKAVAKRAHAFDMNIIYHNRNRIPVEQEKANHATYVSFEVLLQQSDILSIHTPLTASTKDLINASAFSKMKKGAFIVNTGRGGIIQTDALINALKNNHLAGAALDVFENEPHIPKALLSMENVIVAPHNGTATQAARDAMFAEAFGNIVAFLSDKPMTSRVI